jgi:6-phosphogluconolactonase
MNLHIYKDPAELSQAMAEWITQNIENSLKSQEKFMFALTGGEYPGGLYQLLSAEPFKQRITWEKIHFFWGDERVVPFNDPRNNAKMSFDTLLNHVPVKKDQIHIIKTDIDPEQSAKDYENTLRKYFNDTGQSFDLLLTGMGEDAHTLSLFPNMGLVFEKKSWVKSVYLESQKMYRITMTPQIVNRSAKIALIAFGDKKSVAVYNVLDGDPFPDQYPAQAIEPVDGELHWFIDEAAAAMVEHC